MTDDVATKPAKIIYVLSLILLALLPLSALGSRFGLWPYTIGMLLMTIAVIGALLIIVSCIVWLLRNPKASNKPLLQKSTFFSLPSAIVMLTLLLGMNSAGPMIHDISTDVSHVPQFIKAKELRGDSSNSLDYTQQKSEGQLILHAEVKPIENSLSAADNFQKSLTAVETLGWALSVSDQQTGHIEAIVTTFWFGFKDDVVIRVQAGRVDIRSISRVGRSDMGANAKRIIAFSEQF